MDTVIYFIWEVACHYLGLVALKVLTFGKYKSKEGALQSVVGVVFLFFMVVIISLFRM